MRKFVAARINQLMQLFLEFDAPPQSAEQLLHRLRVYGLKGITTLRLTSTRPARVSFHGGGRPGVVGRGRPEKLRHPAPHAAVLRHVVVELKNRVDRARGGDLHVEGLERGGV